MFFHYTHPDNIPLIAEHGLKTGSDLNGASGLEWVIDLYGVNPVYLTRKGSDFANVYLSQDWADYSEIEVDARGLRLVADLPSLVDKGAKYDEGLLFVGRRDDLSSLLPFADEYGWVEIEHLLDPDTDASRVAIKITGTAACLDDICAERLLIQHQRTNRHFVSVLSNYTR